MLAIQKSHLCAEHGALFRPVETAEIEPKLEAGEFGGWGCGIICPDAPQGRTALQAAVEPYLDPRHRTRHTEGPAADQHRRSG